jgi:hypothetical protein
MKDFRRCEEFEVASVVSCSEVLWLRREENVSKLKQENFEGGSPVRRGCARPVWREGGLCDQLETVFCTFVIIFTWTVGYDDAQDSD